MISKRILLVSVLFLAGCAAPAVSTYRDLAAPMSASTRYDTESFAGSWQIVETFGPPRGDLMVFAPLADAVTVTGTGLRTVDGTYRSGVPGELIPDASGADTLVVMWVDESGETAAIGTTDGRFGALIDRDGRIPPDKSLAARAIFEFHGWDTGQMTRVGS